MPRPIMIVLRNLIFRFFSASLLLMLAFGTVPNSAYAQPLTISGDGFKKKSAEDISGAICPTFDTRWCYAVNDEKNYLQYFSINGMTLTANTSTTDTRIRLVEKSEFHEGWELDTEAVAYSDGFVYVAGSHSVERTDGEVQLSRNLLFRFPVDPETGHYLRQSLQGNGLNIEGMAITDNTVVFGLRQPSFGQEVSIFSVSLACLFDMGQCNPILVNLPVGAANLGIRDIARHQNQFFLLIGATIGDENVFGSIFSWNGGLNAPTELARFELLTGEKPEGLLLLPDNQEEFGARAIIFFDGIRDGGPRQIPWEISN